MTLTTTDAELLVFTEPRLTAIITRDTAIFEIPFKQSRQEVWDVLTQKEHLAVYFGDWDLELEVGGKFEFRVAPGHVHAGKVTEIDPLNSLEFTWIEIGEETQTDPEDSLYRYDLADASDGGTQLTITHSKLKKISKYGAGQQAHYESLIAYLDGRPRRSFDEGWDYWLPRYVEVFGDYVD